MINLLITDWGEFNAPDDLPPMKIVMRESMECCGEEVVLYQAQEPEDEHREAFYGYLKAQGERLRDNLPTQTYTEWRSTQP